MTTKFEKVNNTRISLEKKRQEESGESVAVDLRTIAQHRRICSLFSSTSHQQKSRKPSTKTTNLAAMIKKFSKYAPNKSM